MRAWSSVRLDVILQRYGKVSRKASVRCFRFNADFRQHPQSCRANLLGRNPHPHRHGSRTRIDRVQKRGAAQVSEVDRFAACRSRRLDPALCRSPRRLKSENKILRLAGLESRLFRRLRSEKVAPSGQLKTNDLRNIGNFLSMWWRQAPRQLQLVLKAFDGFAATSLIGYNFVGHLIVPGLPS